MDEKDEFNLEITKRLMDPEFDEKRIAELTLGRESPHNAFAFAEEIAQGNFTSAKLEAAQTAGEAGATSVLELTNAHLQSSEKQPEDPVGKTHTAMLHASFGSYPFTESYVHETTIKLPATVDIQSNEEQDRRNQQISEQEPVALPQAECQLGYREGQEPYRQEPESQTKGETGVSNKTKTQKESELENQHSSSMGAHDAPQADVAMAAGGGGDDGSGSSNDNIDIDLTKASAPSIGQDLREEFLAVQQQNEIPVIDRPGDMRDAAPENEVPAIDIPEATRAPSRENDIPVIDSLDGHQQADSLPALEGPVVDRHPESAPGSEQESPQQAQLHTQGHYL